MLKAQEDCREKGMNSNVMDGVTDRGQQGREDKGEKIEGWGYKFKLSLKLQNAFLNMYIYSCMS